MGAYYDNLKQEKQKTLAGFYADAKPDRKTKTANTNFLGLTYHRTFQAPNRMTENNFNAYNVNREEPGPHRPSAREHMYFNVDPN